MFSLWWVIHVYKEVFLQRTSLLSMWYIRNTNLLMKLQSQDYQELLLFGCFIVHFVTQTDAKPLRMSSQLRSGTSWVTGNRSSEDVLVMWCRLEGSLPVGKYQLHVHVKFWVNMREWHQPSNWQKKKRSIFLAAAQPKPFIHHRIREGSVPFQKQIRLPIDM